MFELTTSLVLLSQKTNAFRDIPLHFSRSQLPSSAPLTRMS
jgi:hypothetical protein